MRTYSCTHLHTYIHIYIHTHIQLLMHSFETPLRVSNGTHGDENGAILSGGGKVLAGKREFAGRRNSGSESPERRNANGKGVLEAVCMHVCMYVSLYMCM